MGASRLDTETSNVVDSPAPRRSDAGSTKRKVNECWPGVNDGSILTIMLPSMVCIFPVEIPSMRTSTVEPLGPLKDTSPVSFAY